jgi:hypothetical protein
VVNAAIPVVVSFYTRCGLRSGEYLNVDLSELIDTTAGWMFYMWESNSDRFRETPIPKSLITQIQTIANTRDVVVDDPTFLMSTM